jgi:hypothetical protein
MKLDDILKQAWVPDRSPGYWESFPGRVTRGIADRSRLKTAPTNPWLPWAIGAVTVCLALAIAMFVSRSGTPQAEPPVSYVQLYRQIEAMFPNQVQAIFVDGRGVKLVLAENADVPRSQPLLINACRQDDCRHVITFSGQQVKINGDTWDVLVNGQNQVVVAGRSTEHYRIEGRAL